MSEIENTAGRDPASHLFGAMANPSSYIEDMEKRGQEELVNSEKIPVDLQGDFEAMGFILGAVDINDPLFRDVVLPDGWTRKASDHPMWSHIVDRDGVVRVDVFYKAAFYDRCAFARIVSQEGV